MAWIARLNSLWSNENPPTMAWTRPVLGSMATMAPEISGNLAQTELVRLVVERLDVDHVAHGSGALDRPARPFHAIGGHECRSRGP